MKLILIILLAPLSLFGQKTEPLLVVRVKPDTTYGIIAYVKDWEKAIVPLEWGYKLTTFVTDKVTQKTEAKIEYYTISGKLLPNIVGFIPKI